MIENKHVIAVMPARGGSKRLKNKNIYPIWGEPMLSWGVRACQKSKYIDKVFVSSESEEILEVAKQYGAEPLKRPEELAGDKVFKMHAVSHAVKTVAEDNRYTKPDIIVCLQPNSPQIKTADIDGAIEKLLKYNRQEIFSVDQNLNQNAAFRVLTFEAVFQKDLSTNCGVYIAENEDIHTVEDVERLEKQGSPK
ncbi:MAG TPA: acylneuraminate cytidylyltransferase family protein [Patescibacteria group bacterium]|nr:acylneuraminate cytidylyltransferase family protein [Patescibacteria group bacterium]